MAYAHVTNRTVLRSAGAKKTTAARASVKRFTLTVSNLAQHREQRFELLNDVPHELGGPAQPTKDSTMTSSPPDSYPFICFLNWTAAMA